MPKSKKWALMCPNLEEARKNRERIADKSLNKTFWDELERSLASTPWGAPLPSDVPLGSLPYAGRKRTGGHSIEEDSL